MAKIVVWLYSNKLMNESNREKISKLSSGHRALTVLSHVDIPQDSSISAELKQHLFDFIVDGSLAPPEHKIENNHSSSSELRQSHSVEAIGIKENLYRIQLKDLDTVLMLFHEMNEVNQKRVLDQSKHSSTVDESRDFNKKEIPQLIAQLVNLNKTPPTLNISIVAENLFTHKNPSSTCIINAKQLYVLTRILNSAAAPFHLNDDYEHTSGYAELDTPTLKTEEEVIKRKEKEDANKEIARELHKTLFGVTRTTGLIPLWSLGLFYPVFAFDVISRFFQIPEKYAIDFSLAAQGLWSKYYLDEYHKEYNPSLFEIDLISKYLMNQALFPEKRNLPKKVEEWHSFYYNYNTAESNAHKQLGIREILAVNLAKALMWLVNHDIYTPENIHTVYSLVENIDVLNKIKISNFCATPEELPLKQKVFDLVISDITHRIEKKSSPHPIRSSSSISSSSSLPSDLNSVFPKRSSLSHNLFSNNAIQNSETKNSSNPKKRKIPPAPLP